MRDSSAEMLRAKLAHNKYDAVIVCYAPFMIGAHDDPDSDNYKMFRFTQ